MIITLKQHGYTLFVQQCNGMQQKCAFQPPLPFLKVNHFDTLNAAASAALGHPVRSWSVWTYREQTFSLALFEEWTANELRLRRLPCPTSTNMVQPLACEPPVQAHTGTAGMSCRTRSRSSVSNRNRSGKIQYNLSSNQVQDTSTSTSSVGVVELNPSHAFCSTETNDPMRKQQVLDNFFHNPVRLAHASPQTPQTVQPLSEQYVIQNVQVVPHVQNVQIEPSVGPVSSVSSVSSVTSAVTAPTFNELKTHIPSIQDDLSELECTSHQGVEQLYHKWNAGKQMVMDMVGLTWNTENLSLYFQRPGRYGDKRDPPLVDVHRCQKVWDATTQPKPTYRFQCEFQKPDGKNVIVWIPWVYLKFNASYRGLVLEKFPIVETRLHVEEIAPGQPGSTTAPKVKRQVKRKPKSNPGSIEDWPDEDNETDE